MSAPLKDRIQADLIEARRRRDKDRTVLLSTVLADLRNKEIELGSALDDEGVRHVVAKAIKQRRDAASQMRDGGRSDLADREESEAGWLTSYMPAPLSDDEVRGMVRSAIAAGATEMGPIMARIMPDLRGRFDGRAANRIVREELPG